MLDASAAANLARLLRGPACVVVKHTNPCGAAERPTLLEAWAAALAGDPQAAFGGVVALTGEVGGDVARELNEIFLEVVVAPAFAPDALEILAAKPNLRLVVDRASADRTGTRPARTARSRRLAIGPDRRWRGPHRGAGRWRRRSGEWARAPRAGRDAREQPDLDLAWRLVRGVVSNAIVLVRDGQLVGLGSGQVSRVDACRQAVEKAERRHAPAGARGAVAASDAFFPFPDGPEILLEAGSRHLPSRAVRCVTRRSSPPSSGRRHDADHRRAALPPLTGSARADRLAQQHQTRRAWRCRRRSCRRW